MGKPIDADWNLIELSYHRDNLTCRQLADKFNISWQAIQQRCARHGWNKEKTEAVKKVSDIVTSKLVDVRLKLIEDIQSEAIPIARKLTKEVDRSIDSMFGEAIDSAHLNGLAQALGKANAIALTNAGWVAPVSKVDVTSGGQSMHDHSLAVMASIVAMQEQGKLNTAAIDVEGLLLEQAKQEQDKTETGTA